MGERCSWCEKTSNGLGKGAGAGGGGVRPRALHAAHARTHMCTHTLGRAVVSQWCNLLLPGHQGAAAHWGLRPWAARRGDACGPDRGLGPQGGSEAACLSPWACCSKSCPGGKANAPLGALGPRGGGHRPTPAPPEVWATLPGSVFRTCPSWAVTSGDKVQGRPTALLVLKILATLHPLWGSGPLVFTPCPPPSICFSEQQGSWDRGEAVVPAPGGGSA